ncbi:MAG TPA: HEAT repeat domain-containing protein [Planctomycetota bacterium]|jgi:hypothetical protein
MKHVALALLSAAALLVLPAMAADEFNVDDLEHLPIKLSNGTTVEVIKYNDHLWRIIDVAVLMGDDNNDPDVCFEGKFEMVQQSKLKLRGLNASFNPKNPQAKWASIVIDDRIKHRAQSAQTDLKNGTNVWICGTLRRPEPGVKGLDLIAVDVRKLAPDLDRYKAALAKMVAKPAKPQEFLDLGAKIEVQLKNDSDIIANIEQFEELKLLAKSAYEEGARRKEAEVRADDADAWYEVLVIWRDKVQKKTKAREILLEKVLKINPDHRQGAEDATALGFVKFRGTWMTRERQKEIEEADARQIQQDKQAKDEETIRKIAEKTRAIAEREVLLVRSQADLHAAGPATRNQAIGALGDAIQRSPDADFGRAAVLLLANLDAKAPVAAALGSAAKSALPEVRCEAVEALAWRGSQLADAQAYGAVAATLLAEQDVAVAKSEIAAVLAADPKAGVDVLIKGMAAKDSTVRSEILDNLKTTTQQSFATAEEWDAWWKQNRDRFNPK